MAEECTDDPNGAWANTCSPCTSVADCLNDVVGAGCWAMDMSNPPVCTKSVSDRATFGACMSSDDYCGVNPATVCSDVTDSTGLGPFSKKTSACFEKNCKPLVTMTDNIYNAGDDAATMKVKLKSTWCGSYRQKTSMAGLPIDCAQHMFDLVGQDLQLTMSQGEDADDTILNMVGSGC